MCSFTRLRRNGGKRTVKVWINSADALKKRWVGGEPSGGKEPLTEGVSEKEVTGLLRPIGLHRRPGNVPADLLERSTDPVWIPRKLHGRGVRQKLALPGDAGLDQPSTQKANRPNDQQGKA